MEQVKNRNEKLRCAAQRRDKALSARESQLRATNLRQSEVSRKAMQKRWLDNHTRHEKSFELRQQNEENVMLRKVCNMILLFSCFLLYFC
jgi:hypothetical protein